MISRTRAAYARVVVVVAWCFLAGCSDHPAHPVDVGEPPAADGGGTDAAEPDAGHDAGHDAAAPAALDAGRPDTGTPDAEVDAGTVIHCDPTGGGPYYLQEAETVTVKLRCATKLKVPAKALSFVDLPLGASFDESTATLTWTPTLDQAGTYHLAIVAAPWSEMGSVELQIADRWDDVNNVPVTDPASYTEEYGLPVIHLTTDPGVNNDTYTPATIVYRGHTFTGAQAKLRGANSSNYPKRSYTLKLTKDDKWSDAKENFVGRRKVTLITSFDDNSYLRQRLAFELWNRLSPSHIQVKTYWGVLFLNGAYYGLYTVADHVDGYLMEDSGLRQDGNLYKARLHDANFRVLDSYGNAKVTPHDGYTKEEGVPVDGQPGAYDDLDAFLTWVETASDSEFASDLGMHIVQRDYEDWWLFTSFIMADDSTDKNSYHYHDPTLPTSLWRYTPWDMNESFGQDWLTMRMAPNQTDPEGYYLGMNHLFERFLAEPTIATPLRTRYHDTLRSQYALKKILALYDAMLAEVDASARRDEAKWRDTYRSYFQWSWRTDFTTYEEEAAYVRQWIADRHAYLSTIY
jgi:spore coat protein CotH